MAGHLDRLGYSMPDEAPTFARVCYTFPYKSRKYWHARFRIDVLEM